MNTTPFSASVVKRDELRMFLTAFAVLTLELAMIRWVGTQVRVAAYFSNLVLIAAFLGIGLGAALGRTKPHWFAATLPILAVVVAVLSLSDLLGFVHFVVPDPAMHFWAGSDADNWGFIRGCGLVLLCFWAVAIVFVGLGIPFGWLFSELPPLRAYRYDIIGSVSGVVAMSMAAWASLPSPVWFALGVVPLLLLRRTLLNAGAAVIVLGAAGYSVGGALFSPYNRIDLEDAGGSLGPPPSGQKEWALNVNRDYHQLILDLSVSSTFADPRMAHRDRVRLAYELPFRVSPKRGSAMVVGAGTGNDVAAAVRLGFDRVVSVDIDPEIVRLGKTLHPERPYDDPKVTAVINDARAFFEQRDEVFDVVCYGLLDSHAMFSAMSSLRLDNYVYTLEGVRAGWNHVAPGGVLSISFSVFAGDWMTERLARLVKEATGLDPILIGHGYNYGVTFMVGRTLTLDSVRRLFPSAGYRELADPPIPIPSDDWPFLYLRPDSTPAAYILVGFLIALTALVAVRKAFGPALAASRFDLHMFLLGAGFMLLETRMVTELSLLFGSTWVVNSSVIGGVLLMILLANTTVERFRRLATGPLYGLLLVSLVGIWALSAGVLNRFDLVPRAIIAGLLYALPIFFAGLIFSTWLGRSKNTSAALGANLCGAVLGGLLEYLGMGVGMKALTLLALCLYLGSLLVIQRRESKPAS
ncbi:MAG: hypothetical protein HY791_15235 [Deltaproteobacteria bacterium]|nr:hypothetical protein [Deltaproteobacteria bacterium]